MTPDHQAIPTEFWKSLSDDEWMEVMMSSRRK